MRVFVATGVALAFLVLLLATAPRAEAAEPSTFPAAGGLVWSSVAVRAAPRASARRVTTLYQLRVDRRRQIVLAIGKRRIGAVAGAKAQLTLFNTSSQPAIRLTAKLTGAEANEYRVTVGDGVEGQDQLTFYDGTGARPLAYPEGNPGQLVAQINSSPLPVTATLITGETPLAPVPTSTALAGGRDEQEGDLWYRLNLPVRPFGRTGWVPGDSVSVRTTTKRVVIHRRAHYVEVFNRGRRILRAPVATGRRDRPTPLGNFYVAAKYRPPQNAAVSAYALELSAPAGLPDFLGGGVVGIHGTPMTYTIGKNASNGCIRVHNRTVLRLKRIVPVGTPVKIVR